MTHGERIIGVLMCVRVRVTHQTFVGEVAVFLGHRQEHGQCDTVGKDGQQDDDLEGSGE